ncbi:MAG: alpha/beta fold hydrolase [Hyphomonadaceae bacterium]|nr:alpha/beta fold hydrolase [Hyphomonadaceae bacterium]
MTEIAIPPDRPVFIGGYAARDAAIQGADKLPLIVISHGTGGSGMQMMWLGRALAERGFIAAAVDHHGNTAAEESFDARGFRLPWQRATDLSRVIDRLLADPTFGARVDAERIGAAGFSLGGYTIVALAGGITDLDGLRAFCASAARDATCEPQSEYPEAEQDFARLAQTDPAVAALLAGSSASYRDERVRSFVALAPALGHAFTQPSLAMISAPILFIAGDADIVAPADSNAGYLAGLMPGARLTTLGGATHYVFLNRCNSRGRRFVPICADPEGVDRQALHEQVATMVAEHFAQTLPAHTSVP